jgi:hypothetical protein
VKQVLYVVVSMVKFIKLRRLKSITSAELCDNMQKYHVQNGFHLVHPLQGQTDDSRRVPDVGCGQDGEEQSTLSHFCDCLTCAQAGVRPGIVVKEKDVFRVSVRRNCRVRCRSLFKVPCTARDAL